MKQIAFLEYKFMFDPSETWSTLSEFESQLAEFFDAHDMDVQIVKAIGGQIGQRMMLIEAKKFPKFGTTENGNNPPIGKSPSQQMQQIMKKGDSNG